MKKKWLAVGIILLFVGITVNPITGISSNRDDTTPPVTTISFNPPVPDGMNGWYVSPVTVTLNATDNDSGVNITKYRTTEAPCWYVYTEPFMLTNDGDDILIEYYSIDAAGNIEPVRNTTVDIDRTKPKIGLNYTWGEVGFNYLIEFTAVCSDAMSGMEQVEYYLNEVLQKTIFGSGPEYKWACYLFPRLVRGLIHHPEITEEYVKFYALIVFVSTNRLLERNPRIRSYAYDSAGNFDHAAPMYPFHKTQIVPGIYLFQNMTLPINYTGYIGRFFIRAKLWG